MQSRLTGLRAFPKSASSFDLSFAKRPAEELFDVAKDPDDLHNVIGDPSYAVRLKEMPSALDDWRKADRRPDGPRRR
jgi:hypothetical protein